MNIFIEALMGTKLRLRVQAYEVILTVKTRIMHHEGIPVEQQHLIYCESELPDDSSIGELKIPDGATLRLVIGMRGGPLSVVRPQIDDDLEEELDHKNVAIVVLEESGSIRIIHLLSDGDYGDSSTSARSSYPSTERLLNRSQLLPLRSTTGPATEDGDLTGAVTETTSNTTLHNKMALLQFKMSQLRLRRRGADQKTVDKNREVECSDSCSVRPSNVSMTSDNNGVAAAIPPSLRRLFKSHSFDPKISLGGHSSGGGQLSATFPSRLQKSFSVNRIRTMPQHPFRTFPPNRSISTEANSSSTPADLSNTTWTGLDQGTQSSRSEKHPGDAGRAPGGILQMTPTTSRKPGLPALIEGENTSAHNKITERCFHCRKRLTVINKFQCRCKQMFCSKHRFPEEHTCHYDYKSDARQLIFDSNPLVKAIKLPEI